MFNYILRRLLLLFPTLIGMTAVTFFVMGLSPGGVGGALLNNTGDLKAEAAKAQREYLMRRYGLGKPLIVQYVRWLNEVSPIGVKEIGTGWPAGSHVGAKRPDLGESFAKGRPVLDLVADALPITLLLNVVTLPITYVIAISFGILAAKRRGTWVDTGSGFTFIGLSSIPIIWAGVLLIGFFANRQYLHWFPTSGLHDTLADTMPFLPRQTPRGWDRGWLLDTGWHLVLPIICLTYASFAFLSRLTRGTVLDNLHADYARTARAKGVAEPTVLLSHVFRNSLIPLITASAGILPGLFGGSLIVENIFSINGMGTLMIQAIQARDRELVLDEALVIGLVGLLSYLVADVLYAVADPRVSYE